MDTQRHTPFSNFCLRLRSLRERADDLLGEVDSCVKVINRINQLVDLRDREKGRVGVWLRGSTTSLKNQIESWQREIDGLYVPFGPTEIELRAFVHELRRVLNAIPIRPPQLRQFRSEVERLPLIAAIERPLPLEMRASYDDLLTISHRLLEMIDLFPASEGEASGGPPRPHTILGVRSEERQRQRGPDLATSQRRIELEDQLRTELATIKLRLDRYADLDRVKKEFPLFALWRVLSVAEQEDLITEEFKPRAFARVLTMREFGLSSPDTIKKDRQRLRKANLRTTASSR
jgi:hypothetical protein